MMDILVDLVHIADVNFYKKALSILKKKGHRIHLTVMDRGKLYSIASKELSYDTIKKIGKHRKGFAAKLLGILSRTRALGTYMKQKNIEVATSFGFYPGIAARGTTIKRVLFHDDPEYKLNFFLCKQFSDLLVVPEALEVEGSHVRTYRGFKELAYLDNFTPRRSALTRLGLQQDKYVFIRDVDAHSLNYAHVSRLDISLIAEQLTNKGYQVVYYPEQAPEQNIPHVITVRGSLPEIHSLLYYAAGTISTGDTTARESALLGTPTLYLGEREMKINSALVKHKALVVGSHQNTAARFLRIATKQRKKQLRLSIGALRSRWDSTSNAIVEAICS